MRTQAIQMLLTQSSLKVLPTTNFAKTWGYGNRGIYNNYIPELCFPVPTA